MLERASKGLVRSIDASNTTLPAEVAKLVVPKLLGRDCLLLDLDLEEVKLKGSWAATFGDAIVGSEMLRTLRLPYCELEGPLPELQGCPALQTLDLSFCKGLSSLPERLGECVALQELSLQGCAGLTSLPDLSSLPALTVYGLPDKLQPWATIDYEAYSLPLDA